MAGLREKDDFTFYFAGCDVSAIAAADAVVAAADFRAVDKLLSFLTAQVGRDSEGQVVCVLLVGELLLNSLPRLRAAAGPTKVR